jgi:hypothetical protein
MVYLASFLLSLVVAWFLASPLLESELADAVISNEEQRTLLDQRERLVQVMRDLELDFSLRNITEQDYRMTKAEISRELAAVLERLDAERVKGMT